MAAYTDFETELLAAVATATGTVRKQTLFTSVEAARVSIVEAMKPGDVPIAVAVQLGSMTHDPEWGVGSRTYRAPVSVAILIPAKGNNQATVHALGEAVADAIDGVTFTTFQAPPERASIDSSEDNPLFQSLAGDSKVQIVACMVRWEPGLLVQR